jgi:hypothetical protein
VNDSAPDALQRLITERMRELRRSYGDVARLGKLPPSTVDQLATHRHHAASQPGHPGMAGGGPRPAAERGPCGSGISRAGFDTAATEGPEIDVLVASVARLSPADRRHFAALLRSMLAATDTPESLTGPLPRPSQCVRAVPPAALAGGCPPRVIGMIIWSWIDDQRRR